MRANVGYVGVDGGGFGEVGIGNGGDNGVEGSEGCVGITGRGSGESEPKAVFRVDGSSIVWKDFDETSTLDRIVKTSL